jgi:hypothetical protein
MYISNDTPELDWYPSSNPTICFAEEEVEDKLFIIGINFVVGDISVYLPFLLYN